ncbi:MAG: hypothetical protein V4671_14920 [Armatimonadota bacterium]
MKCRLVSQGIACSVARSVACFLGILGGSFFFWGFLSTLMGPLRPEEVADAISYFQFVGCLLLVSWLLYRFADSLFPFGKRAFR